MAGEGYLAAINGLFEGLNKGLENRRARDALDRKLTLEETEWETKGQILKDEEKRKGESAKAEAKFKEDYIRILGSANTGKTDEKTGKGLQEALTTFQKYTTEQQKFDNEISRLNTQLGRTTDPARIKILEAQKAPLEAKRKQLENNRILQQRLIDQYSEKLKIETEPQLTTGDQASIPQSPQLTQFTRLLPGASNKKLLDQLGDAAKLRLSPEDYRAFIQLVAKQQKDRASIPKDYGEFIQLEQKKSVPVVPPSSLSMFSFGKDDEIESD